MTQQSSFNPQQFIAIVPAAGVGARMQAACPKQYLSIDNKSILDHTLSVLQSHPRIKRIVCAISPDDGYFGDSVFAHHQQVTRVDGGVERADSVFNCLHYLTNHLPKAELECTWVMVHDAARPCLSGADIDALIDFVQHQGHGAILATPVRDTMKRASTENGQNWVSHTEERQHLWHALTPQCFPLMTLYRALQQAFERDATITDEASAIEGFGGYVGLVEGQMSNLKITHPQDLALAELIIKAR
ncbi:2-C-methyl-D-erythritol 4-phosphate cytidylyltransferase [Paraferrimonas haliotis]|uniref:2-C-methyl-D-erythritol 4-phosphate cytidylyltransferase n=1 Tax=Paraferrimonas haliotis TaxID=2013866 RepID=A0AA37TR54_9GAMM|nr:2-C-methyl-D-erythritol 4-phosphate cytidylyltransferase [Paraferrimonas haliotis]GLS82827.1 2-C-methyl-D-erythritol 4-phosphate cytidylyltransferase [Paraferrimonas haliotis]